MDNKITQQPQTPLKKGHWKRYPILFLLVIILAGGGYGYYWYRGVIKTKAQADQILNEYNKLQATKGKYDQLVEALKREQIRCKDFISQGEGQFGEFEYCKKFVEWADASMPEST